MLLGVWGIKAWMSSLYADLGLSDRSASPSTVRRAWQKLALELHPDRNIGGSKDAARDEAFVRAQRAWEVLGDAEARTEYDKRFAVETGARRFSEKVPQAQFEEVESDNGPLLRKLCRCGDYYELALEEQEQGLTTVQCNGRQLWVTVVKDEGK